MLLNILETILEILLVWMAVSIITFALAWYWMKVSKREPANHLPPLPHNSILGKQQKRAF